MASSRTKNPANSCGSSRGKGSGSRTKTRVIRVMANPRRKSTKDRKSFQTTGLKNNRASHGPSWWAGPGLGRSGPPIICSCSAPRPGPARQSFRGWTVAWPGPSTSIFSRPGPVQDIRSEIHETWILHAPARHLCGPARGFEGVAHVLPRTIRCTLARFSIFTIILSYLKYITSGLRWRPREGRHRT